MTYKQSVQRARQLTDSARRNYYEGKVPAEKTPFLVPVVAAHVMAG